VKAELGWAPSVRLVDGLRVTWEWIAGEVAKEAAMGVDTAQYRESHVVCQTTDTLDAMGV